MGFDKEIEIDIGRWIRTVIQKVWLIVITTVCGAGVALAFSITAKPVYEARTVICSDANLSYKEASEILFYLKEYADISSRGIAERAKILLGDESLSADEIMRMVDYDYEDGKAVLFIETSSEERQLALDVANAVSESFVIEAQSLLGTNSVKVLEGAVLQESGVSSKKVCILGGMFGFICPIIVIVFAQVVSDKIYYVSDAELGGELDIIGVIPEQAQV